MLEFIVKVVVTIINFALWIAGILLIVFGGIALGSPSTIISILNVIPGVDVVTDIFDPYSLFEGMAIFMIVLGSFLFLFGFVGCHGVWKMHKRMMCNYWILLILGVLTEIAIIIYGAVYPPTVNTYVQTQLTNSLASFQSVSINTATGAVTYSTNNTVAAGWEMLQSQTHCCGVMNYTDYATVIWSHPAEYPQSVIPPTCCSTSLNYGNNITNTTQFSDLNGCLNSGAPTALSYWTTGCWINVINMVWQFDYIAIIIASCLMAAQLIGIVLTAHQWHKLVRESGY